MLLRDLMSEFLVEGGDQLPQFLTSATSVAEEEHKFVEWEPVDSPCRLIKDYQFGDRETVSRFVLSLMRFEDVMGHHATIVVEYTAVRIEVYTHDVNDITELDTEYAKYADSLFADVRQS